MTDAERPTGQALVQRARAATGLGQAAFARLLGLHHTTVWYWEHGKKEPNPTTRGLLLLVADAPGRAVELLTQDRGPGVVQPARGNQRQVLAAVRELSQGSERPVPLDRLRVALKEVRRSRVDRLLLHLEERGKLLLTPPLFPACLGPAERAAVLETPDRGPLLFAQLVEGGRTAQRRSS